MLTTGTWLGPIIGSVIAVIGVPWGIALSKKRTRRSLAIERIAKLLAPMIADSWGWGRDPEFLAEIQQHLMGDPKMELDEIIEREQKRQLDRSSRPYERPSR